MHVPPRHRRVFARMLAVAVAAVLLHGVACAWSVSFFCSAMQQQVDEPCCRTEPASRQGEWRAAHCPCCERRVATPVAPAIAHAAASVTAAPWLATHPPALPVATRSMQAERGAPFVPHTGPPRAELERLRSTVFRT